MAKAAQHSNFSEQLNFIAKTLEEIRDILKQRPGPIAITMVTPNVPEKKEDVVTQLLAALRQASVTCEEAGPDGQ